MKKVGNSKALRSLKDILMRLRKKVSDHAPEILTGMGLAGLITTSVMVAKEAPVAKEALENAEAEKGEPLTVKEKVSVAGKIYSPAIVSGALTGACIVGSNKVSRDRNAALKDRNAALATAYVASETMLRAYGDKVVEVLGEKEAERVQKEAVEAAVTERMTAHPVKDNDIIVTGHGDELCYDMLSDRYFMSNYDRLKENAMLIVEEDGPEGFITVNDWYQFNDLKGIPGGDRYGFDMMVNPFGIDITSKIAPDKRACLVVTFKHPPQDVHGRRLEYE